MTRSPLFRLALFLLVVAVLGFLWREVRRWHIEIDALPTDSPTGLVRR